jgi:hypothetical protein
MSKSGSRFPIQVASILAEKPMKELDLERYPVKFDV